MYIPIIKNVEKFAGQLSYGFNIQDKLEGCTQGKKFLMGIWIFLNFVYKRFGINRRVHMSNFTSFQTFFIKRISFVKLTHPSFF